jgi:hypothetical protein
VCVCHVTNMNITVIYFDGIFRFLEILSMKYFHEMKRHSYSFSMALMHSNLMPPSTTLHTSDNKSNSKRMESLSKMSSKESYQILHMFSRLQPGNLKKKIPNVGIICTHKTQLLLLLDVLCLDIVMLNL